MVPRGRGGRGPAAALQSSVGSELSAQAVANITTTATAISAVAGRVELLTPPRTGGGDHALFRIFDNFF